MSDDKFDVAFDEFMKSDGQSALARCIALDLLDYEFATRLMQRAFLAGAVWGSKDTGAAMIAALDKPRAET